MDVIHRVTLCITNVPAMALYEAMKQSHDSFLQYGGSHYINHVIFKSHWLKTPRALNLVANALHTQTLIG